MMSLTHRYHLRGYRGRNVLCNTRRDLRITEECRFYRVNSATVCLAVSGVTAVNYILAIEEPNFKKGEKHKSSFTTGIEQAQTEAEFHVHETSSVLN